MGYGSAVINATALNDPSSEGDNNAYVEQEVYEVFSFGTDTSRVPIHIGGRLLIQQYIIRDGDTIKATRIGSNIFLPYKSK